MEELMEIGTPESGIEKFQGNCSYNPKNSQKGWSNLESYLPNIINSSMEKTLN